MFNLAAFMCNKYIECLLKKKNIINSFCFSGGKFMSIGEKIRLPDDVTMGYIIGKF